MQKVFKDFIKYDTNIEEFISDIVKVERLSKESKCEQTANA